MLMLKVMAVTPKRLRLRLQGPVIFVLALFGALISLSAQAEWQQQHRDIMGTRISVELWHSEPETAADCSEQVFAEMRRIDRLMSSYIEDSELSLINKNATAKPMPISSEMALLIEMSLYFSKVSKGAFDITYASVGYAYDYRKAVQPSEKLIDSKLPAINYRHIELAHNRVHFKHSDVRIDLGGIAKGYAVDRALAIITDCGITEAMISAGGDSRIVGDHRGRSWMIGIRHPRAEGEVALRVPLSDTAVSTSGDYERFFIDKGERVHHIINPTTGRSAKGSWSATVTGPNAMTTDALSTTVFILGPTAGIALIESLDGIDAIIIDNHGKVHYSSGFEQPEVEG